MINIPSLPHAYDFCIILSFIIPFCVIFIQNKKRFKLPILAVYFVLLLVLSLGGGILMELYQSLIKNYRAGFGLSSYGGAVGMLLGVWIFKTMMYDKQEIGNALAKDTVCAIPLIYGISKLACSFAGCCHGFDYSGPLSVKYVSTGGPYFPVQFIEVFVFIIIYAFARLFNKKYPDYTIPFVFITSGIAKAGLDFLRYDCSSFFTANKVISYLFIVLGISMIIYKYIKKKQNKRIKPA